MLLHVGCKFAVFIVSNSKMLGDIINTTSFQSYLLSLEGKCIILATYLDGKAYPVLWLIIAVFPEAQNV